MGNVIQEKNSKINQVSVSGINSKLTVDDFKLLKVIGKGSFGKVFQVKKIDSGKIYAMKVLKKETLVKKQQIQHTITERRVLENIDHPFIVSLRYAFQTDDKLYIVCDYFTGGELFFHLKNKGKFSIERTRFYVSEIVLAIECLHNKNIVYRDIKPENILLDNEGHIRLADFGLSKESITENGLAHTFCGTPEYLAPEILLNEGHGKPVDWWSLGMIMFEMLTGLPPFYTQDINLLYDRILNQELQVPQYVPFKAADLLYKLLEKDGNKRLGSIADAVEVKSHPFFNSINWDDLLQKKVTPPFVPKVQDDTSYVDKEFTCQKVQDTPVNPSDYLSSNFKYPDFTYVSEQANESDPANRLRRGTDIKI